MGKAFTGLGEHPALFEELIEPFLAEFREHALCELVGLLCLLQESLRRLVGKAEAILRSNVEPIRLTMPFFSSFATICETAERVMPMRRASSEEMMSLPMHCSLATSQRMRNSVLESLALPQKKSMSPRSFTR